MRVTRRVGAGALLAVVMVSCATTQQGGDITAHVSEKWRVVGDDPLTLFPHGFPDDEGTSTADGEWVYAGRGSFFVPKGGVPGVTREVLVSEALELRERFGDQYMLAIKRRQQKVLAARRQASGSGGYKEVSGAIRNTLYSTIFLPGAIFGGKKTEIPMINHLPQSEDSWGSSDGPETHRCRDKGKSDSGKCEHTKGD